MGHALANIVLALVLAPLMPGIINRVKSLFAGRTGPPLLQLYYDLRKLLGKGAVYSATTTWLFRAGPIISLAAFSAVLMLMPCGGPALVSFAGDLILAAYLLGLARFFIVLAALDTGSSFEAMGASRELQFAVLAEPAMLLGLAALARATGALSLGGIAAACGSVLWRSAGPALVLISIALLIVFLVENARVPFDDPNTHLELTMIHEVMVLDHSGPDFALIQYGAAVKLWLLGALIVNMLVPVRGMAWVQTSAFLAGMAVLATVTGVIESLTARWRLTRVPHLLVGATALTMLALILTLW